MFFAKNLPMLERVIRIAMGFGLILSGMLYFQGGLGSLWGLFSAVSGVGAIVTGFLGFCPACAMVGRKPGRRARET